MLHERVPSADGYETNFAVNTLGAFALTLALEPALHAAGGGSGASGAAAAAAPAAAAGAEQGGGGGGARVVFVSSGGQVRAGWLAGRARLCVCQPACAVCLRARARDDQHPALASPASQYRNPSEAVHGAAGGG